MKRRTAQETYLWQLDRQTGEWHHVRTCHVQEAQEWLRIFQEDEPTAAFKIAIRKPR